MSIRWILSLGIIGLLLVMAISQIFLIHSFRERIEQQISSSSSELTQVVLDEAKRQLIEIPLPPTPPEPLEILRDLKLPPPETLRNREEREAWRRELQQQLEQNREERQARQQEFQANQQEWQAWQQQVQHQVQQQMQQNLRIVIQRQWSPEAIRAQVEQAQQQMQLQSAAPLFREFTTYTVMLIVLSTSIAMLISLWLGHRLIQPLHSLVAGFRTLQQGQLGQQISVQGLREYRYVSAQFNLMSVRLAELAQMAEQAQQQQHLVEIGEMSRGLVHALRNPLHTLTLLMEQLGDEPDADKRRQLMQQAEQKIQHINRSLTSVLTLSCAEVDRQQQVSVSAILHDLRLEFSASPVRIELDAPTDLVLAGAEQELRAIIHTLLSNAVEASPANGMIRIRLDVQCAALCITDQGSGLEPAIAEQLFQPHISSKPAGAGMGLYIAQRLMQRYYQGRISLENLASGGCRACLFFAELK
ncbi:HAMP domain-containing sensor histidine kinase [Alkalimonas sp.]|uniref:sensor histidine kinase n=1 Tax=Alkalimonas sp. TaxID=1872453 RepID=UPI00263ADD70|nr:HAMP domain-containing sensor histidine kinase [Alkalimonas sp.]MCC5826797.1 HAMP domain-containing histidine kinase [Alkalimonas sp.]